MAARGKRALVGVAAGFLSLGLLTLSLSTPASAQGIFERIFGGLRRVIEAPSRMLPNTQAFVDPLTGVGNDTDPRQQLRVETGPARAFCVRTCDGHFFPVQAHAGLSAAESCKAFCPGSQVRLYSGGNIDYAVASDGSRYADLDNAFVYRKKLVAGCTCNGRNAFGLAHIDVNTDPTLRPGDIVATKTGLAAFTGVKNHVADFTPIGAYRGLSETARDKLSAVKIMPPAPSAAGVTMATIQNATDRARDDRRRAQLER